MTLEQLRALFRREPAGFTFTVVKARVARVGDVEATRETKTQEVFFENHSERRPKWTGMKIV